MSTKRSVVVVDNGQEFGRQLKLVLEFMGLQVNVLYVQDCSEDTLPASIKQSRLCFVPFDDDLPDIGLKVISRILTEEVAMPMVLTGHSGGLDDMSFVIGGVRKMPTFDQLQQFLYAADAHWARLSKVVALQAYIREEIDTALADLNVNVDPKAFGLQEAHGQDDLPRQSRHKRELNATAKQHLNDHLVGGCEAMQHVKDMIARVHDKNASVLITGESGTGKEVVARMLHDLSPRRTKAFVPVNCGAIPAELLESELFGHEKGAFTGAIAARAGRFEIAEGGTLFLDEIGDMPLNMQVKILRVLQERVFERVGSTKSKECDVRVIAATHRNLEDMIEKQSFRADLFYRLNVFPIEVPALRERVADLGKLVPVLVKRLAEQHKTSIELNSDAIESLARHHWPGNIRELSNLLERLMIMFPGEVVTLQDLPVKYRYSLLGENRVHTKAASGDNTSVKHASTEFQGDLGTQVTSDERAALFGPSESDTPSHTISLGSDGIDLKEHIANIEKDLIQQALDESEGVVARAAELLQMRRTTLVEKMRKYDMSR
jgi:sigma-54 dependent transcriptional regulator, flagellar regulatory protein